MPKLNNKYTISGGGFCWSGFESEAEIRAAIGAIASVNGVGKIGKRKSTTTRLGRPLAGPIKPKSRPISRDVGDKEILKTEDLHKVGLLQKIYDGAMLRGDRKTAEAIHREATKIRKQACKNSPGGFEYEDDFNYMYPEQTSTKVKFMTEEDFISLNGYNVLSKSIPRIGKYSKALSIIGGSDYSPYNYLPVGTVLIDYNADKRSSENYVEYYDPDGKLLYVEDYGYDFNSGLSYNRDHWLGEQPTRQQQRRGDSLKAEVGKLVLTQAGGKIAKKYVLPKAGDLAKDVIKKRGF